MGIISRKVYVNFTESQVYSQGIGKTVMIQAIQRPRNHSYRSAAACAFTMIELLVVVAIIAVLAAMLLPALSRARESGRRAVCVGDMRQIMLAMIIYSESYEGSLPPQRAGGPGTMDWSGLLVTNMPNAKVFHCLSDQNQRVYIGLARSYAVNSGKWTYQGLGPNCDLYKSPWPRPKCDAAGSTNLDSPAKLADVPPQVILIGENHGDGNPNGAVVGIGESEGLDAAASSVHRPGGGNYGFSDGRVEFLSKEYVDNWRADTDYTGQSKEKDDPWKWK